MTKPLALLAAGLAMAAVAACGAPAMPSPTPGLLTIAVELGEWRVSPAQTEVSAGEVVFALRNVGVLEHEFVVFKTDLPFDALPLLPNESKVNEDAGDVIGEVEPDELQPSQEVAARFDLEPGQYALLCNIVGHYQLGMRSPFTVR